MSDYVKSKMNVKRAGCATNALSAYKLSIKVDDCDAVTDLLCDLMHLCKQKPKKWGDFSEELDRAERNFRDECNGKE